MSLFGKRSKPQYASASVIPDLGAAPLAANWRPSPAGRPFDGHVESDVHEISRVLRGVPRGAISVGFTVNPTVYGDAFRGEVDGRTVMFANGWTAVTPAPFGHGGGPHGVAVCAVELTSLLPLLAIEPRRHASLLNHVPEGRTGNPVFDERFRVARIPLPGAPEVLTPAVQQRVLAHDDWFFRVEDYYLACISPGVFHSAAEVRYRIEEMFGIIAALPASVAPPVDHSNDALLARLDDLDSPEDAMMFLQSLSAEDRQRLAHSGSPLAVFADVHSPQEIAARFQSMGMTERMQLLAMFMRARDREQGR